MNTKIIAFAASLEASDQPKRRGGIIAGLGSFNPAGLTTAGKVTSVASTGAAIAGAGYFANLAAKRNGGWRKAISIVGQKAGKLSAHGW